jgi:hypothetical protein
MVEGNLNYVGKVMCCSVFTFQDIFGWKCSKFNISIDLYNYPTNICTIQFYIHVLNTCDKPLTLMKDEGHLESMRDIWCQ